MRMTAPKLVSIMASVLALSACAGPEPIVNYDVPYEGKYAPLTSPRPEPRAQEENTQRRWLACPEAAFNEDCGNGGINAPRNRRPQWPADLLPLPPVVPQPPAVEPPDVPDRPVDPDPEPEHPVEPEEPDDRGPKGNNGVGNGEDPQPPGNPPVNDGPGTGPGNPGNKGGKKNPA